MLSPVDLLVLLGHCYSLQHIFDNYYSKYIFNKINFPCNDVMYFWKPNVEHTRSRMASILDQR